MTSDEELAELIGFAHRLADAAAEVTLSHFRERSFVEDKSSAADAFDPVTAADRDAEAAIRALIERTFPDHGIHGEEAANKAAQSAYTWFIDPIDGTRSFITGVPLWGTLIGLEKDSRAIVGLVDQPYVGERFIGSRLGAELISSRGRMILRTSDCADLAAAKLGTTSPLLFAPGEERDRFEAAQARVRLSRYGGDCYFYAMLAAGHVDLVIEAGLNPFDVVALIPIIEAAGGVVSGWDGGPANGGGRIVAAATRALHAQALTVLAG